MTAAATDCPDPGVANWGLPAELLSGSEEQFVAGAYRRLLAREPDPEGLGNWVGELRSGTSRIQVLAGLLHSREGGERRAMAPELCRRVLVAEAAEAFVEWPVAASLPALLALGDTVFVRCAYLTVLGRAADSGGLAHYVQRVREGESKSALLAQLRASDEGRARAQFLGAVESGLSSGSRGAALDKLLALPDEAFPEHASLAVLSVFPPRFGRSGLRAPLGEPESRLKFLRELSAMPRAQELRSLLAALDASALQGRLAPASLLGPILRLFRLGGGEDEEARVRRRSENLLWMLAQERMAMAAGARTEIAATLEEAPGAAAERAADSRGPQRVAAQAPGDAIAALRTLPPLAAHRAGAGR